MTKRDPGIVYGSREDAVDLFEHLLRIFDLAGEHGWLCSTLRDLNTAMLKDVRAEIGRRTSGPSNDNPEGTR